ncbi:cation:proton antiporter [Cellulosimicrobium marinum]|uniref:cation:proton antiporter n=1 Tax=Cellulosimicrobium marinum TaxID=1638992 RepID=UPI001E29D972|nr:cation:proton antiporter [Cellulosimicrobium marinum]MCB7135555.1 cation:proton antiporter [Cellulosimicrobium marinum]
MDFPFQLTEDQILGIVALGASVVVAIVVVNVLAPRAGVAAPLVLVLVGIGVSFVPVVPAIEVEPEWILAGVLPPLLYSSAVSLPTMDFRRDFTAIGGLSVALVVVSSVALGFLFTRVVPGIPLSVGIALGAVVSPTDAVATSIVKRLGASPRVVTVLEGESLLNDASALVLLRSAIAATAASVSLWSVAGDFVVAVVVAVAIGFVVGLLGLAVRSRLGRASLSVAVSFVVPFVAYLPAELLGASGLVAVVTAGLVTGNGAAKHLRPQDRISEESNWRTIELLLEGGVFLLVGLELFALVEDVVDTHGNLWSAVGVAALALLAGLLVRAAYVLPLVHSAGRRARRGEEVRGYIEGMQRRLDARFAPDGTPLDASTDPDGATGVTAQFRAVAAGPHVRSPLPPAARRTLRAGAAALPEGAKERMRGPGSDPQRRVGRIRSVLRRRAADIDYLRAQPLGPREGVLLVWAGLRGVVTVAAAQTLPLDTPHRSFLVLVAFGVALGSLLIQGGTLPWVVRRLGLAGGTSPADNDRGAVRAELDAAAARVVDAPDLRRADGRPFDPGVVARVRRDVVHELETRDTDAATTADVFAQYKELRLRAIAAQRTTLLDARSSGVYSSQALRHALDLLDAEQIDLELRRGPVVDDDDRPA